MISLACQTLATMIVRMTRHLLLGKVFLVTLMGLSLLRPTLIQRIEGQASLRKVELLDFECAYNIPAAPHIEFGVNVILFLLQCNLCSIHPLMCILYVKFLNECFCNNGRLLDFSGSQSVSTFMDSIVKLLSLYMYNMALSLDSLRVIVRD